MWSAFRWFSRTEHNLRCAVRSIAIGTYFVTISVLDRLVSSSLKLIKLSPSEEEDDCGSIADSDVGSCKDCVTESTSPRLPCGSGESRRGGRGGGGELGGTLIAALGGGECALAVCTPFRGWSDHAGYSRSLDLPG